MYLSVKNFRCIYQAEYYIQDGSITLITGYSGKGKSTIFEALKWCLYGSVNHIYPYSLKSQSNKNTQVILKTQKYTINRSQPPKILKVLFDDGTNLEFESAQNFIDRRYGSKEMFEITSYIPQGSLNRFFTLSNSEKFAMIEHCIFEDSDNSPEDIHKKIDFYEKELTQQIMILNDEEKKNIEEINKINQGLNDEDYEFYDRTLFEDATELNIKKHNLNTIYCEFLKLNSTQKFDNIQSLPPDKYPSEIRTELKEIKNKRESYLKYIQEKTIIQSLIDQEKSKSKLINYTISQIEDYLKYIKKLEEFEKKYNIDNIDFKLEDIDQYDSQYQKQICTYIDNYVDGFCSEFTTLTTDDIDQIKKLTSLKTEMKNFKIQQIESKQKHENRKLNLFNCNQILQICKNHQVDYDSVREIFIERKKIIDNQPFVKKRKELESNLSITQSTKQKIEETLEKNYHAYRKIYLSNSFLPENVLDVRLDEISSNELACPNCKTHVKYIRGILMIDSNKFHLSQDTKNDIITLQKEYITMTKRLDEISLRLCNIQDNINEIPQTNTQLLDDVMEKNYSYFVSSIQTLLSDNLILVNISNEEKIINEIDKYLFEETKYKELLNLQEKYKQYDENQQTYLSNIKDFKTLLKKYNKMVDVSKNTSLIDLSLEEAIKQRDICDKIHIYKQYIANKKIIESLYQNYFDNLTQEKAYEILAQIKEQKQINDRLKSYNDKLKSLQDVDEITDEQIIHLEQYLQQSIDEEQKYKNYLTMQSINERQILLNEQLKNIDANLSFEDVKNSIDDLETRIHNQYLLQPIKSKIETLIKLEDLDQKIKNKVKIKIKKLQKIQKIKFLSNETRNETLTNFINSINVLTNQILSCIFNDGITSELKLYRENKTNDKIRQMINFEIYYRGNIYDSINYLSGGEKDRLSLAFTIAFFCVTGGQILILDECLSSLDDTMRELCIKTIKRFLPQKTILNVCHSVNEAHYECILQI
jgi:exonuclease SbcC